MKHNAQYSVFVLKNSEGFSNLAFQNKLEILLTNMELTCIFSVIHILIIIIREHILIVTSKRVYLFGFFFFRPDMNIPSNQ